MKPSFLPHVDHAACQAMTVAERIDVNRRGHGRYVTWRQANPELVAGMQGTARARIGDAGM